MKPRKKGQQYEISYRCPGYSKPFYERFSSYEEANLRIAQIEYEKIINELNIMFLKLMYITNSVDVALIAEKYGVDRIWIDLETLGKQERQGHIDSVKSKHSINDIKKINISI